MVMDNGRSLMLHASIASRIQVGIIATLAFVLALSMLAAFCPPAHAGQTGATHLGKWNIAIELDTNDDSLVDKIKAMDDGQCALVKQCWSGHLPKAALQAIAGTHKAIAYRDRDNNECNCVEAVFDGSCFSKAQVKTDVPSLGFCSSMGWCLGTFVYWSADQNKSIVYLEDVPFTGLLPGTKMYFEESRLQKFKDVHVYSLGKDLKLTELSVKPHLVSNEASETWWELDAGNAQKVYITEGPLSGKRDISNYQVGFKGKATGGIKSGLPAFRFTGKPVKPKGWSLYPGWDEIDEITSEPRCYNSPEKLTEGRDFTVSYKKNRKSGVAKVVIRGLGEFSGSRIEYPFFILPAKVKALKAQVVKAKRTIKLSWNAKTAKKSGAKKIAVHLEYYDVNGQRISSTDKKLKTTSKGASFKYPYYTKKVKVKVNAVKNVKWERPNLHWKDQRDLVGPATKLTVKTRHVWRAV